MCDPGIFRERVINPNPVVVPPPRQIERFPEPSFTPVQATPVTPPNPTFLFQAAPPPSTEQLNEANAKNAAPQALGGLAARFTTPVGKQGYSKSLRPEQGRLVR